MLTRTKHEARRESNMSTRTFIAVELGDAARASLARTIGALAPGLPDVRFVKPESLHLTLAFLGDLEEELLMEAMAATAAAAETGQPFELVIEGLGMFGPQHAPRVIWAGVQGNLRALVAVQARLAEALEAKGFAREERPFAPHLTLARLKRPLPPEQLTWLRARVAGPGRSGAPVAVAQLSVMESVRRPSGAEYTCLRAYALG